MSQLELVLVTGASGYVGSHVVRAVLDAGYRVRGYQRSYLICMLPSGLIWLHFRTARGGKLGSLREYFKDEPNFEAIQIDDVGAQDLDLTAPLDGVSAIIHVACPLGGRSLPAEGLRTALEGSQNILKQALKAGVYKVVLTSTSATALDPDQKRAFSGGIISDKDWGKTSEEDVLKEGNTNLYTYSGYKTLSEQAAWKFAEEHPELDLASVNPPFVYGDPIPELLGHKNYQALSSNFLIYQLILGPPGRPLPPQIPPYWVSIHDIARAHVLALRLPKLPAGADVRDKRFIVAGSGHLLWGDAVKVLLKERPELKERLPSLEDVPPLPGPVATLDTTRATEVLGLREYRDMNETLVETIDALLRVEKAWNSAFQDH
ncbi:NAD-P-binding protein [Ganoderma leucocontextum]|nr:NAD-P-binding protein [Ganoderma leucocontextum]